ncbi:DUF6457 domain-containing protein [Pengzhenrongella sp.]|jgi:hypothetical protein|uniref:DUF6457 domain-containing protein n=1 Tax=Pengzhenrongella sp. TaxID=2888820 RepID=UPI002F94B0BE
MDDRERWIASAALELGIDEDLIATVSGPVLDMVRDIAHGVNRPSAPLTAFLVGLAAGAGTADATSAELADAVIARLAQVDTLVQAWDADASA